MRWIIYTLLAYILVAGSNEHPFATTTVYGEVTSTTDKESSGVNAMEEAEEENKEIRIKKDEFDEIVGQLQGMKALLENMKQDYDTRFKEMQEKIVVLEKENTKLKISQSEPVGAIHESPLSKAGDNVAVGEVNSRTPKVSTTNEEEKSQPPQTGTVATSPPTPPSTESIFSQTSTTATSQPMTSESEKWVPAQPLTVWSMAARQLRIWKNLKRVVTIRISVGLLCKIWKPYLKGR